VGIGEAAYGPTAPTLISDLYPVKTRGQVLAWFYAAIPVGGALGYVLGGAVAGTALGWRGAFLIVVPPGLLLGAWCFFMREPARGQAVPGSEPARGGARLHDYLLLARIPSYVLDTLGMTALTFAVGGIAAWMPTYLYQNKAQFRLTEAAWQELQKADSDQPDAQAKALPAAVAGKLKPLVDRELSYQALDADLKSLLSEDEARRFHERIIETAGTPSLGLINLAFGGITVVSGLVATILGGIAGDRLQPRFPGSYFLVSGISMLLAFPMLLLVVWTPLPWVWLFVFLGVFFLFFNTGPSNTILANVTHPSIRSTAFALNILLIHLFGDAFSPVVMGAIADQAGMDFAFLAVSVVVLIGAALWLWGIPYLERDTQLAPTRLAE
jgi:MFS family permease